MEDEDLKIIIDGIKILISVITLIFIITLTTYIINKEEKEYTLICETKQEIIITDGEDIITIEKKETKGENKE